ncbi:site-specific DNA-methyltransferase [Bradyrhizobium cenepequi]
MATKSKKTKSAAKSDVENYKHDEAKRVNIPTAENQKLVHDDDKTVKKLRWKRNPDLDPQLVWRGKDFDSDPLEVDAPPIYIQEKIQPRAIVEELRKQTRGRHKDGTSQFDFFHDFNGLPEGWKEDATQSYYHDEGNWQNRMILGDSLLVMASLSKREGLRGKVQCIYMDPPYGIRFNSNWQPTTKSSVVKETGLNNVSREPEVIRAFRDTWRDEIHSYLEYLRDRLFAAKDLLSNTGSFFIQIGIENVHLVRALCDEVFRPENFVTQISVQKTGSLTGDFVQANTDLVVWYVKDREQAKSRFRRLFLKRDGEPDAATKRTPTCDRADHGAYPMTSDGFRETTTVPFEFEGQVFHPGNNRHWGVTVPELDRVGRAGRIIRQDRQVRMKYYWDDFPVYALNSYWNDVGGATDKVYVVQTSPKIIERCLLMTTAPGDLVLDPTCGSGTTAYVAEQWGRRRITIDTSRVALTLARSRLMGAKYDYYLLKDSKDGAEKEGELTGSLPTEGPYSNNIRHDFVYERVPHVTLKSIADNAEIDVIWARWQDTLEALRGKLNKAVKQMWEEWQVPRHESQDWPETAKRFHAQWWEARRERQKEMDQSIARNKAVEYLYDRPHKMRGVVRVAGPFTVESLSPHRVLPMGEDSYLEELLAIDPDELPPSLVKPRKARDGDSIAVAEKEASGIVITDFAQVVYENLKIAGVQNTKKGERLMLENLRPFASRTGMIQFQGEYREKGATKRAAVSVGPEYDTVGYELVRRAAREAADLFDVLIVCGFAFAPEVDDTRLHFGGLTVLKARMNQDLRMADKLKASGAANLFVVFGEPDIAIKELPDDQLQVEIRGMDIFDPTTGEVRSSGGNDLQNDVAAWFIDHEYDEESFFVRQAYFVGDDPYEGLKRALKSDIDGTAWAELNSTISRPFRKPKTKRICVKVINHFGDEVQKVFVV